jgi:hypothetical protein
MLYRLMQSWHWMGQAICTMLPSFNLAKNIGTGGARCSNAIGDLQMSSGHSNSRSFAKYIKKSWRAGLDGEACVLNGFCIHLPRVPASIACTIQYKLLPDKSHKTGVIQKS